MIKKGVFISFCWKDLDLMYRLSEAIEGNQYLYPIVVTNPNRADSQLWNPDKVAKGINECSFFVPIISSNSLNNQWVNQEVGFAAGRNKRIYPIVQRSFVESKEKILKGWISHDRDLPYQFELSDDIDNRVNQFRTAFELLIEHLSGLNRNLEFSNLLDSEKQALKAGKLVFCQEHGSPHAYLTLNNYAYPIASREVYKTLKVFLSQKQESMVEKDVIEKMNKGQLIR